MPDSVNALNCTLKHGRDGKSYVYVITMINSTPSARSAKDADGAQGG